MINFYDVDNNYLNYLRTFDDKIPLKEYTTHDKFVCGVVLELNGIKYYAPVSHFNIKQRTNMPIMDRGTIISTVRFCFMFPAYDSVLIKKDFTAIANVDRLYCDLLNTEYHYCKIHEEELRKRSESVYKIGCNKNHPYNNTCCDFKLLEQNYLNFDPCVTY